MYFKYRQVPEFDTTMQSAFYGLNKNARISEGEFADMTNMTGDYAPLIAPRAARTVAQRSDGARLNGILGDVGFCAVWGNELHYMGDKVDGVPLADSEKNLVAMGANILVFPDAVYYNTVTGEHGNIDTGVTGKDVSTSAYNVIVVLKNGATSLPCEITNASGTEFNAFSLFKRDGGFRFEGFLEGTPESFDGSFTNLGGYNVYSVKDGKLYYVYRATETTERGGYGYGRKSVVTGAEWREVPLDYCIVQGVGGTSRIGLADADTNNLWCGGNSVHISNDGGLRFEGHGAFCGAVTMKSGDGVLRSTGVVGSAITEKTLPMLDYVCVHGNRLWGCRYGTQINGATDCNEIYCSALGDFKNWTTGTGADNAFSFSVGAYGKWTGCASVRGNLLFFKEDAVYRVTGDRPSNISADIISENGVQEGCEKSICAIDNVLYYKSGAGVYVYDGSVPHKISDALGNGYYERAVAGKHIDKYYISMAQDGARKLYVYDTRKNLWHAEDDAQARFFAEYDGALYAGIDSDIVCLAGDIANIFDGEREETVEWSIETGDIGLSSPYPKWYHRILLRMEMAFGAKVAVDVSVDGGEWQMTSDFSATRKQSFLMPVVTPRCDHMRIRIRGKGDVKIYSICYETETTGGNP